MAENIVNLIKSDAIGVIPTDTIYGIVGSALSKVAVEKIYKAKKRDSASPFIILISKIGDLETFGINPTEEKYKEIKKNWPGKVTLIFPLPSKSLLKFKYLHRGNKTLAFRLPQKKSLISLIKKTGPLVAPSANISGKLPAKNITEARAYFGNKSSFYKAGKLSKKASKIISLVGDKPEIVRK